MSLYDNGRSSSDVVSKYFEDKIFSDSGFTLSSPKLKYEWFVKSHRVGASVLALKFNFNSGLILWIE